MKKVLLFAFLAAMLLPMRLSAQTLNDAYDFTTGVDSTKWVTLSENATTLSITGDDDRSAVLPIGFSFYFAGTTYTDWSCNTNGRIKLGSSQITTAYALPFSTSSNMSANQPLIAFIGRDCQFYTGAYAKYETVGEEGSRVLVAEFHMMIRNYQNVTFDVQVQLAEADQSITIIYGERTGTAGAEYQIGVSSSTTDLVLINATSHEATYLTGYQNTTNPSGSWPDLNRWYKLTFNPTACVYPSDLAVASNTTAGTTLTWTGNENAMGYSVLLGDDDYRVVYDTSVTFTGLTPATTYTATVRSLCSDGDSSHATTISFLTPCATITSEFLPYYQDFETFTSYANYPMCLQRLNYRTNSTSNYPTNLLGTDWAATTHQMVYFQPGGVGQDQYVIFPEFDNITSLRTHFYTKRGVATVWLEVGIMENPLDTSTFTRIDSVGSVAGSSDWSDFIVPFNNYSGSGTYPAFRARSTTSGSYILLDDVTIETITSCTRPDSLTVDSIGTNSARLTIHHDGAPATANYRIILASSGSVDTVFVTASTVMLNSLTPGTVYDLYVSMVCGDEVTPYVRSTFNTECGTLQHSDLPFVENFDSYAYNANAVINPCYHRISFNPSYPIAPYPKNEYQRVSGVGNTLYYYPGTGNQMQYFVLPEMANVQDLMLDFWVRRPSSAPVIEVGIMSDPDSANTFTLVQRCIPSAVNTWEQFEVPFASYSGDGSFIAIRALIENGSSTYVVVDDIRVKVNACPKPYDVTVAFGEDNDATLTWPVVNEANEYEFIMGGDTLILNTNSVTVDSLQGLTEYQYKLRSLCASDSSNYLAGSFQTPLDTLPYYQDFNQYTTSSTDQVPAGWKKIGNGHVDFYTGYQYDGTRNMRFYDATADNVVLLPTFPLEISQLYLAFVTRPEGTSASTGQFDVGYVTDANNATSFVAVATYSYSDFSGEYQDKYVTFTGAPAGARMAMRHRSAASNYYWFVDNIEVNVATCAMPGMPEVSDITATGATLTWPAMEDVSTFYLTVDSTTIAVSDTTYTFTTLTPATSYTVYLWRLCDQDSSHASQVSFQTNCVALTHADLPYIEDFESYTTGSGQPVSPCWTIHNFSTTHPYPSTSTGYNGLSTKLLYCYPSTAGGHYLVLPEVDNVSDLMLSFRTRTGIVSKSFDVGVMTDRQDTSTFALVQHIVPTSTSEWEEWEASLSTYSGAGHNVAIRITATSTSYCYLDDVVLMVQPSCMHPQGVVVRSFDASTASFAVFDTANLGNYQVVLYQGSTAIDTVTVTDTTFTLTGLDAATSYSLSVYGVCSDNTLTTPVSTDFHTALVPSNIPYTTSFEVGDNNSWVLFNGTNGWTIGNAASSDGTRSLYISNDNGTTNAYNNGTTSISYAVCALNIPVAGDYAYSFDWRAYGEGSYDFLRVWLAPGDAEYTANLLPSGSTSTSSYTSTTPAGWTDLASGKLNLQSSWQTVEDTVTINATGTYHVVVMWANDGSQGTAPAGAIDNFSFVSADGYEYIPPQYTVTVSSADAAMGTVSPAGATLVDSASTFTATATAADGYHFAGWTITPGYTAIVTDNPVTVTVSEDMTLVAQFEADFVCETPTAVTVSAIGLTSATIGWTAAEGQDTWEIHISGTGYNDTIVSQTNPYTVTGLSTGVEYTVTVRANCGDGGNSDWSNPVSFTTATCQPVTGVMVSNRTTNSVQVSWTAPAGVSNFELEYGASGFASGTGTRVETSTNSATLTGLTAGMAYDVYVRSVCGNGAYSPWSNATPFTTEDDQQGIDDVNNANIALFPNPATTTVTLTGIDGQATVTIVDMNGRVNGEWKVESGNLTIDLTGYAQGAYFVRITGEQLSAIRKLIVK